MAQVTDHRLPDVQLLDLRELEDQGRGDVRLLGLRLAPIEETRLAVVIGEALRSNASPWRRLSVTGALRKPCSGASRGESA